MFKCFAMIVAFAVPALAFAADKPDPAKVKKGLQDIGEFVGQWNLDASSKAGGKATNWKETVSFTWKFKGDDSCLAFEVKDGKLPSTGELRFDPEKKIYTLKTVNKDKKEFTFAGEFKKGKLLLERKDESNGDVSRLIFNTLSEGVRMNLVYETQQGGSGPFETVYKAAGTKEGESFAGGKAKKPECIVTGGTASIQVSYMGKTYWVCCTGCRDEFNENPKKYIEAAEKKNKK